MKLYIVRHGETNLNVKNISQGHTDSALNVLGKKQAQLLGELLEVVNFDIVYSSDLQRAKQTTAAIMKYQQCKVIYTKKLREANYGIFDGKPYEKMAQFFDEAQLKHPDKERFELQIPKGETGLAVQKRVVTFIESLYKKHRNDTVLISTHGRVKRLLIGYIQHIPLSSVKKIERFQNCSLTVVEYDHKKGHRVTLQNHIKHLSVLNGSSYVFRKNN
jgi:probable phosphoglycerate mutase